MPESFSGRGLGALSTHRTSALTRVLEKVLKMKVAKQILNTTCS
jgi:hypothetical protein